MKEHAQRPSSRLSGFYRLDTQQRYATLVHSGVIADEDVAFLCRREGGLSQELADQMSENVIGVLELPLGLGLNFVIDGHDYIVPMAVEEPSVIAAVSHTAAIIRGAGGFETTDSGSTMIGQIQVVDCPDLQRAVDAVRDATDELVVAANQTDQPLIDAGGGAVGVEVRVLRGANHRDMLVVHLLVDCVDAMGANAVNTMVEAIAPRVEELTQGRVFLRILSNLADRRTVHARCRIPFDALAWHGYPGAEVAEAVALASEFAVADPYRAATHNKGVMNGVSAVAVATGNDWRAVEAGAHAYAARNGQYGPLATWRAVDGHLVGELEMPAAVGIVGGPIRIHPTVQLAHRILRVQSAAELGRVMAAVGLAQNLAALKALGTEGIQRGHMALHARTVAIGAGAAGDELDACVSQLVESSEVRVDRAAEILEKLRQK